MVDSFRKFKGVITKIVVDETTMKEETEGDVAYTHCSVDGGPQKNINITIRRFLHQGHPLEVYVNGGDPLYPTVVYDERGNLLGVTAGMLGAQR